MTTLPARTHFERIFGCAMLAWAGFTFGVAFVATPAKFLAPSLSLAAALDVGRHTFAIYNRIELGLLVALCVSAVVVRQRELILALIIPALVVLAEAFWLIPALDAPVRAFLADPSRPPVPSVLHTIYIAIEAIKLLTLVLIGGRLALLRPL